MRPAGNHLLVIQNRQKIRRINAALLRRIVLAALKELAPGRDFKLCLHLVSAAEITRLNEHYLHHAGPTDVIAFDWSADYPNPVLAGEIFVCLDEAVRQARRYQCSWPAELARYAIHGLLHLLGFDDQQPRSRRVMKRVEQRTLRLLQRRFALSRLAKTVKLAP
jgi:probable rRNA maturation factor